MLEINMPILGWLCISAGLFLGGYYFGLRSKVKKLRCQICGSENVVEENKTETFEYKDHKVDVPNYVSLKCYHCGQSVATKKSVKKAEPLIKAMHEKAGRND